MLDDKVDELRAGARAFAGSAFAALRESNVLPTPIYHRFVRVGRDYFGDEVNGPELHALERLLTDAYPDRFAEDKDLGEREFASSYVFSVLEACVARCGGRNANFDPKADGVDESIEELLHVLAAPDEGIVVCRFVSHLTTATGAPIELGDVTVVPEPSGDDPRTWRSLTRRIVAEIPGAESAFNRDDPRPHDPPYALLIVREKSDAQPYDVASRLSGRLERFLLLARLLTSGTVNTYFEVQGPATLVSRMGSLFVEIHGHRLGLGRSLVRRTIRLHGSEAGAIAALDELIRTADVKRAGMLATSFDVALAKFHGSNLRDSEAEQLVDLATALEAVLSSEGDRNEGLTLRLRNRAAALLATADDPAPAIFDDVGRLYDLRSMLVHGGQIAQKDLRSSVRQISTVTPESVDRAFGIAIGYAVDRLRDLVRRSILARLCLAADPDPLWPFIGRTPIDASLSDDEQRAAWRTRWHERLANVRAEAAAGPATSAVDFLSPEDR